MLLLTRGVNHILEQGTKLNPLIKDAKTITFTWEKVPDGVAAVDVSVTTDGETKAKDVWMWDDGEGNYKSWMSAASALQQRCGWTISLETVRQ